MIRRLAHWLLRLVEPPVHDSTGQSQAKLMLAVGPPARPIPRCVLCACSYVQTAGAICHRCEGAWSQALAEAEERVPAHVLTMRPRAPRRDR